MGKELLYRKNKLFMSFSDHINYNFIVNNILPILSPKDLTVLRDGIGCDERVYLNHERKINNKKINNMFLNEKCSIYIRNFQEYDKASKQWLKLLEKKLKPLKIKLSLFASPELSVGIPAHFDATDMFVMQICGSKNWDIWDSSCFNVTKPTDPLDHIDDVRMHTSVNSPTLQITLEEKDLMYLPRGTIHSPYTKRNNSIHMSAWLLSPLRDSVPFHEQSCHNHLNDELYEF
jgi:Uncharacterized conserved protein